MVAAEKRHTPELRFGGFSEEWAQKTGAEITDKITKGSSPTWQGFEYTKQGVLFVTSENVRDGFLDVSKPKYLPVEFYDKQKNSSLRFGDILINIVGASIGRCCLYSRNERAFTNQAVALFRVKESNSIDFVAYCYQQSRIQKIISGTQSESARPNLSLTDLRELQFNIPSPSEQQKIAAFLGAVDNKLTALRRRRELLQEFKRGMMQKIFSRELRFKREDGSDFPDWEEKRLGEIAKRSIIKNTDCIVTRVLTNSATKGVVDQQDYFNKDIANADNLSGYYIVEKGDFVYNPRISVHAPVGPIKKNLLGQGVMSPLYTVFSFNVNADEFFEQYFKTNFWHKYMCSVANYGARHDRMNIGSKDIMAMPLPCPHLDEQQKIADCLSAIDSKIESVAKQIGQVESFKKGLLQKMFV